MMHRKLKFILLFFTITFTSILPAQAKEDNPLKNDANAQALEKIVTEQLEKIKSSVSDDNGEGVTVTGKVLIEKADDYYAATLPALKIEMDNNKFLNVGLIAINATPIKNSKDWKMSVALPMPFYIDDKDGNRKGQFELGSQTFGGIYNAELNAFSKFDLDYKNLSYTTVKNGKAITIDQIKSNGDLQQTKGNLWKGLNNSSLSNIKFYNPKKTNDNFLSIGKIDSKINIEDFDPLLKDSTSAQLLKKNATKTPPDFARVITNFFKSSGDTKVQIFAHNIGAMNNTTKESIFKINNVSIGNSSNVSNDDKLHQSYSIKYDGLQFTSDDEMMKDVVPTDFKTDISFENLPIFDLINHAQTLDIKDKASKQIATQNALNFIPEKLKQAGAILKLNDTSIKTPLYQIDLDGDLQAAPKSNFGAFGNLSLEMTGLEQTMTKLQETEAGKRFMPQMAMIQMISEKKGDKNVAVIKLSEDGKILVNGKDMSLLGGLMSGGR